MESKNPCCWSDVQEKIVCNCDSTRKGFQNCSWGILSIEQKADFFWFTTWVITMQFSHGNAKNDRKPFFRTCPSVISVAKSSEELPSNVYKQLVSQPTHSSDLQPVLAPRNVKQIRNAQASQRQKCRLSHDTVYNLFEMAYDTQGFVHKIESYPNLLVFCGLSSILDELFKQSWSFLICFYIIPHLILVIFMYHLFSFAMLSLNHSCCVFVARTEVWNSSRSIYDIHNGKIIIPKQCAITYTHCHWWWQGCVQLDR